MSKLQVHNQRHSVIDVTSAKENWNIVVRVIRLWFVTDLAKSKIPFSIELILQDKEGVRIHGSIRRTLIYKFQSQIYDGSVYSVQSFSVAANGGSYKTKHHPYKINFQFGTKITSLPAQMVRESPPEYIPLSFISGPGFDIDYLDLFYYYNFFIHVDIIGVLTGVGIERKLQKDGRKIKLNVISLDCDGFHIECTLFGNYVDELNAFLSSAEVQNVVVSIEFGKVKVFQDKVYIQNCIDCTKVQFNLNTEAALALKKKRMSSSSESPSQRLCQLSEASEHNLEDEFLQLTPRNTIERLKDCKEVNTFIILRTIKHVFNDDDWWYTACVCNKAVYQDSKIFFCEKCNKHVMKVSLRYKIKLCIVDETNSTTFILFDREAKLLLNKSSVEIFESHDKNGNLSKEFSNLLDKSFLFKVDSRNDQGIRFE
ncbi:hypothetical protein PHAVU_006G016100 [Phaseolus vulgaris]|uniref:DUF223 domain-containing protein n=1 Tax=Phaseolus vulgaris TaxID=3885 RepID=V7BM77_PHAVU|nr:hypothetical protein PHAVU_006G016100g [Phaseolus vulgaris]ESW18140.1 hypothetical protein PHAVU_006G016100g [Phaseolus vulgaris]